MPKLSIIVPVFNAAQYLHRCIDSILSQSFTDYELLLIDDGSKDESGAICDEYAAKDERIRVFHKENGGVSSARNLGLDHAQGEWIYFVDADDECKKDGLQTLINGITPDIQVVLCGYEKFNEEGICIYSREGPIETHNLSQEECIFANFDGEFHGYYYLGWMCVWMFNRQLINKYHLRFNEKILFKEDTLFIIQYLCKCVKHGYFTTQPIYKYYESSTSIFHAAKKRFEPKYITSFDACVAIKDAICSVYSSNHRLVKLSYQEIWNRYYLIRSRMLEFHHIDNTLLHSLRKRAFQETSLLYTIQYQYIRNKRRTINFIKRHI